MEQLTDQGGAEAPEEPKVPDEGQKPEEGERTEPGNPGTDPEKVEKTEEDLERAGGN